MQRWAWLALIVGLTLGLSSQPAQAQAQNDWCVTRITFDGVGDPPYTVNISSGVPVGTVSEGRLASRPMESNRNGQNHRAQVWVTLPSYVTTIYNIRAYTATGTNSVQFLYYVRATGLALTGRGYTFGFIGAWSMDFGSHPTYAVSFPYPTLPNAELLLSAVSGPSFTAYGPFQIDTYEIYHDGPCGPPELTRPIAAANASLWGVYGQSAFSSSPGKPVHSPADGHISTLRRATTADCGAFGMSGGGLFSAYCTLNLPSPVTVRGVDRTTGEVGVDHPGERIWIVSVTTSSGTYTYMVANADLYVSIGQTVSSGCVLGQTMRVDTGVEVLDAYNEDEFYEFGVAGVPNETFDSEPNTFEPCNNAPENRGCLGDSTLTDRAQWESGGGAIFEAPGYRLPPGGYVQATYILDSSRDPRMSAIVRPLRYTGHGELAGPSDMRLQLGITVRTLELSVNEDSDYANWQTLSIPAGPHPPDLAGFWTVRLENISPGWIQVNKICVALGADVDPPEPPGPGGGNPPPPGPPPPQSGQPTTEGTCGGLIPFPVAGNESLTSWISWLWAKQAQFFRCDLIRVLRSIQESIGSFARMVGFSVRWNMATFQAALNWMDRTLLPWLAGYMANMRPSTVTVESGCNSFWCALASILGNVINGIIAPIVGLIVDLIGMAAELLGQILSGIIDLIFSFINAALALLNIARVAFAVLLDAWINTPPATIPGWATCPPSPDASSPLCILFWVLDNTAFTQAGALIIPLLTGWFSLHIVLWFVSDIKQTFIKLGQAT